MIRKAHTAVALIEAKPGLVTAGNVETQLSVVHLQHQFCAGPGCGEIAGFGKPTGCWRPPLKSRECCI
jgi:hypothetical protein